MSNDRVVAFRSSDGTIYSVKRRTILNHTSYFNDLLNISPLDSNYSQPILINLEETSRVLEPLIRLLDVQTLASVIDIDDFEAISSTYELSLKYRLNQIADRIKVDLRPKVISNITQRDRIAWLAVKYNDPDMIRFVYAIQESENHAAEAEANAAPMQLPTRSHRNQEADDPLPISPPALPLPVFHPPYRGSSHSGSQLSSSSSSATAVDRNTEQANRYRSPLTPKNSPNRPNNTVPVVTVSMTGTGSSRGVGTSETITPQPQRTRKAKEKPKSKSKSSPTETPPLRNPEPAATGTAPRPTKHHRRPGPITIMQQLPAHNGFNQTLYTEVAMVKSLEDQLRLSRAQNAPPDVIAEHHLRYSIAESALSEKLGRPSVKRTTPLVPITPLMPLMPLTPLMPMTPKARISPMTPKALRAPITPMTPKTPITPMTSNTLVSPMTPKAPKTPIAPIAPKAAVNTAHVGPLRPLILQSQLRPARDVERGVRTPRTPQTRRTPPRLRKPSSSGLTRLIGFINCFFLLSGFGIELGLTIVIERGLQKGTLNPSLVKEVQCSDLGSSRGGCNLPYHWSLYFAYSSPILAVVATAWTWTCARYASVWWTRFGWFVTSLMVLCATIGTTELSVRGYTTSDCSKCSNRAVQVPTSQLRMMNRGQTVGAWFVTFGLITGIAFRARCTGR